VSDVLSRLSSALADRYRLEREVGAGGMATVYLAHDLRHDREVAIKVLHPDLGAALGGERFLNEIKTTAKLQHPHVLPLLDSGEADGLLYYVMPYVTGETLRARLERERQLPIDDALRITREVADALGAAHALGIVHRDIKPENILLQGGHALVADFGIALAVQSAGGARMTQTGLSLGTPQYMSPEQAMGEKTIDARSDIYALGAVLYEMLTGDPPFSGSSVQAIVAKVVNAEPEAPTLIRRTIPARVEVAVLRALAKLPADRWSDAGEFVRALADGANVSGTATAAARRSPVRLAAQWTPLTTAAALVAVSAVAFGLWLRASRDGAVRASSVMSFVIQPPPGFDLADETPSLASDGHLLAFIAESAGTRYIALRRMNAVDATILRGTAGEEFQPSLSPDGATLYFQQLSRVMRAPTDGGQPPAPVAGVPGLSSIRGRGFDVADDGSLLLSPDLAAGILHIDVKAQRIDTLRRVNIAAGEYGILNPTMLPGGRALLFSVLSRTGFALMARTLDGSREVKLVDGASAARFSAPALLVYAKGGDLYSAHFDPSSLALEGSPLPIAQGLPSNSLAGSYAPYFDVSAAGVLAILHGPRRFDGGVLQIVDRASGRRSTPRDSVGTRPHFSPDGRSLLAEDSSFIWIHDLTRGGTRTRFSRSALNYTAIWTPDGSRIAMSTYDGGPAQLWSYAVANPADARRLTTSSQRRYVASYSPDGKTLAFIEANTENGTDIWIRHDDGTETPLVKTPKAEHHPRFSPDGRLLAYASDATGRLEVYVQDYPATERPVRVSADGGTSPVWDPSGRQLFYLLGDDIMSVAVQGRAAALSFGTPRVELRTGGITRGDEVSSPFDISPDGRQFVLIMTPSSPPRHELHVIIGVQPPPR
jgi:hypothetical protein